MRRNAPGPHARRPGPPRLHGSGPLPWLLLLLVPVVSGGLGAAMLALLVIAAIGATLVVSAVPALAVGTAVFVGVRHHKRRARRRAGAVGGAPLPARPGMPRRPEPVPPHVAWHRARARFHALRSAYAAFECDPMQVLRLPALADVSVASTARFVDAFAEAQALETDQFPGGPYAAGFAAAADRAERAWQAAREAAERIRLSGLSPAERGTVERVVKLLTTARDSDSAPERLTAYAMARSELAKLDRAGVIQLPRTAQAGLDAAARGALPA